jgi:ABC-type transport system involved in multi-copper enzyme maturation permease subunit
VVGICWSAQVLLFAYVTPFLIGELTLHGSARAAVVDQLVLGHVDLTAASSFPLFGGAVMLILGAFLTGTEYRWRTWATILTQQPSRVEVVLGKVLATMVVVAIVVLASYVVAVVASIAVGLAIGHGLQPPSVGRFGLSMLVAFLISCVWAVVGMFLGILFRGATAAVAVGLFYALGLENVILSFSSLFHALQPVREFLLGANAGSLVAALAPADLPAARVPGVLSVVGAGQATVALFIYLLLAVFLSALLVRRQDVA